MRLMIYMMQFLTSILFPGNSRIDSLEKEIKSLREELDKVTSENEIFKKTVDDFAMCIDQLATTVSFTVNHIASSTSKDPVDDALDSIWSKDDDGPGYLN